MKLYALLESLKRKIKRQFRNNNKLTILNIPKRRWVDADERMFHACFSILGEYVEKELGKEIDPLYPETEHRGYRLHSEGDEKPIDLWIWYKEELPKVIEKYEDWLARKYSIPISFENGKISIKTVPQPDDKIYEINGINNLSSDYPEIIKDSKLSELIAIRRTLWT